MSPWIAWPAVVGMIFFTVFAIVACIMFLGEGLMKWGTSGGSWRMSVSIAAFVGVAVTLGIIIADVITRNL